MKSLFFFFTTAVALTAQVTPDQLLHADKTPANWLTYSGNYNGQRHSPLTQITPANAKDLEMKWVFQADTLREDGSQPHRGGWRHVFHAGPQ